MLLWRSARKMLRRKRTVKLGGEIKIIFQTKVVSPLKTLLILLVLDLAYLHCDMALLATEIKGVQYELD